MYADTIFATPDDWGSMTIYADQETMNGEEIPALRDAGGDDWDGISLGDCDVWTLVESYDNGAIYEENGRRHPQFATFTTDGTGYYTWGEAHRTLEDAREILTAVKATA